MYKNSIAWKTEMRVSGNIYYTRKLREESFHAGYRAGKKTGRGGNLAQLFQRQAYAAGLIDEKTRNRIRVALVRAKAKKQGT